MMEGQFHSLIDIFKQERAVSGKDRHYHGRRYKDIWARSLTMQKNCRFVLEKR